LVKVVKYLKNQLGLIVSGLVELYKSKMMSGNSELRTSEVVIFRVPSHSLGTR